MSMSVRGLSSGMDVNGTIDKLVALERQPITMIQARQAIIKAQQKAWQDLNLKLKNLGSSIFDLKLSTTYTSKTATAGDSKILTATATTAAALGTYNVNVTEVATAHSVAGSKQTTPAGVALNLSGTLNISGIDSDGKSASWDLVVQKSDTLQTIKERLNAMPKKGFNATIIDNTLVVTSTTTGVGGKLSVADDAGGIARSLGLLQDKDSNSAYELSTIAEAKDAALSINGLELTGSTNSISGVIEGVTLTLAAKGTSTLTVVNDTDKALGAVKKLIDAYNAIQDKITAEIGKDGNLNGDSTLMSLQARLRSFMQGAVSGNPEKFRTLADVGITTGKFVAGTPVDVTGKLTIDETVLKAKLNENPAAVQRLFYGSQNAALGATITASDSDYSAKYPLSSMNNGVVDSTKWGAGEGWNNATSATWPLTLTVPIANSGLITGVTLYTLNSDQYPAGQYGISDFSIYNGTTKLGGVTGGTTGKLSTTFTGVDASLLTINLEKANGANDYARVIEVEVTQETGLLRALEPYINSYTQADGISSTRDKTYSDTIKDMDDQIARMEERVTAYQERLVQQFTQMDTVIGQLNTQSQWLTGQLAGISNFNYSGS